MGAHASKRTITLPFTLEVDGERPARGSARIDWSPQDPATLSVHFANGTNEVNWQFARELLRTGIESAVWAGELDVKVRSNDWSTTRIRLHSPDGIADVVIGTAPLRSFLNTIDAIVPAASLREDEAIAESVDAAIERILTEAS